MHDAGDLQIDFGQARGMIGGEQTRALLFVATLGFSRRGFVCAFRHERQSRSARAPRARRRTGWATSRRTRWPATASRAGAPLEAHLARWQREIADLRIHGTTGETPRGRFETLLNEGNPSHAGYWASAQGACAALNLVALRVVASTPAQLGA